MTLCIDHLTFERNNTLLFSGIHCTLHPTEILQVRGANGSGKSTMLRILAGYIRPEKDAIFWEGKNIFQQLEDYTQQLFYLGHQNALKPHLTVYENLALGCALLGKKFPREQLTSVLRTMQLEHLNNTHIINLSAGQKRRLALSHLLLSSARLWILDEPTASLDDSGKILLIELLENHMKQGGMAIVATHDDLHLKKTVNTLTLGKTNHHV